MSSTRNRHSESLRDFNDKARTNRSEVTPVQSPERHWYEDEDGSLRQNHTGDQHQERVSRRDEFIEKRRGRSRNSAQPDMSRAVPKPKPFQGSTRWNVFKQQFSEYAEVMDWGERTTIKKKKPLAYF
ncbi:hypothetical protein BaRGS_00001050 [Batillaria attramentaria]|uniref:Uncharacterized protein n=1 Tax=Batillaria attramentaria TaxID=370345 RepID=A0ABD0M5U9_9CAEN